MSEARMRCQRCSTLIALQPGKPITRGSLCDACGAELHCCLNCRFHDFSLSNECLEPLAEWVARKDRANFCDFFAPLEDSGERPAPAVTKDDVRQQLGKLFKK